jgi:hypothetical protein
MDQEVGKLLARLDERSFHMVAKVDDVLDQLKKLNSKVAHHETEIHRIKMDMAENKGITSGINRTLAIGLTIIGIISGAIATMLWH